VGQGSDPARWLADCLGRHPGELGQELTLTDVGGLAAQELTLTDVGGLAAQGCSFPRSG
jgi:hypothetical protein